MLCKNNHKYETQTRKRNQKTDHTRAARCSVLYENCPRYVRSECVGLDYRGHANGGPILLLFFEILWNNVMNLLRDLLDE